MNVLIVSPHPDDETLGAGGTLIKLKKQGHKLFWLNITDMKPEYGYSEKIFFHRQKQISDIVMFYSFQKFYNLALPPTRLSSLDEGDLIGRIKVVFEAIKPEWIIIPGAYDAHSDHHVVYNCCMACSKSFRAPYIKRVMTMEILSETDYGFNVERFEPNLYVDITEVFEGKVNAMKIYDTELEEPPFPRSIENIRALATYRGGSCGCKYAEAFHIVKQVE